MLRRLLGRMGGIARDAGVNSGRMVRLPRRLEEAIGYFAARSNPYYYARSAYLGDNTVLALLHGRLQMYLDTRGTDIAPHIMMFGIWEPNYTQLFQRIIRPGDTVFDIGCHLGVYTLLGAAATGLGGQVHAFDPNARFVQLLRRSVAVNGFGGFAKVHNLAVGAEEGVTELRFTWEYAGGGHIATGLGPKDEGLAAKRCRVAALDDLFPDPAFTVDVVKMDVEGTETYALRGMRGLLARSPRARVMFEFAPQMLASHGTGAAELIGLFEELGFRFWNIRDDASLEPATGASLAALTDGLKNVLAARTDPYGG